MDGYGKSETIAHVSIVNDINRVKSNPNTSFKEPHLPQSNEIDASLICSPTCCKNTRNSPSSAVKTASRLRPIHVSDLKIEEDHTKGNFFNYSANEFVNVCYAKMWRPTSRHALTDKEKGSQHDQIENQSPNAAKQDLDKLQKLRLASKYKSRKRIKCEVKKWCESSEAFVNVLQDIREHRSFVGLKGTGEDLTNNKGKPIDFTAVGNPPSSGNERIVEQSNQNDEDNRNYKRESLDSNIENQSLNGSKSNNRWKSQVHFPNHVLLCSALQDDDNNEVSKILKNNTLDINSLIQTSGCYYLHKTIINDQFECAKVLVENGVNVHGEDNHGITPLALAFRLTNFRMVALLVDSGASVEKYTKSRVEEIEKVRLLSSTVSKVFEMEV